MSLQIFDIDANVPFDDFKNELDNCIANDYPNVSQAIKEVATKNGKSVYKITLNNSTEPNTFEIVFEKDPATGNVVMMPLGFTNMNKGFYSQNISNPQTEGTDEDCGECICAVLEKLMYRHKGTIAYIDSVYDLTIIHEGKKVNGKLVAVDSSGKTYGTKDPIKMSSSTSAGFSINKPIGEWMNETLEVRKLIQGEKNYNKMMDIIGKYLIDQRLKDQIEADEFTDIFRQAGLIGFTDKSVLNIYKLMM